MATITEMMFNNDPLKDKLTEIEESTSLSSLSGSKNQVSWASKIRMEQMLNDCHSALRVMRYASKMGRESDVQAIIDEIISYYAEPRSAAEFIDNKVPHLAYMSAGTSVSDKLEAITNDYREFRRNSK